MKSNDVICRPLTNLQRCRVKIHVDLKNPVYCFEGKIFFIIIKSYFSNCTRLSEEIVLAHVVDCAVKLRFLHKCYLTVFGLNMNRGNFRLVLLFI